MFLYGTAGKIIVLATFLFVFSGQATIHMWRYLSTRQSLVSTLLFVLYLVALLLFISLPFIKYKHIIIDGISGLFLVAFPHLFTDDILQNPYRYLQSETSFQLLGAHGNFLPVNAPELGMFVVGKPGCGKTKFVIEPILFRMIAKGYGGMLYDYDFSNDTGTNYSLSQLAYNCHLRSLHKTRFLNINFQDLTLSARINPIAAHYIEDRKKLSQSLRTLILNLNPDLAHKEDFWQKNTYAMLKSLVVFLANKHPIYCSLPHVIMMGLQSSDVLKNILAADEEAKLYASPVLDALENAPEQFAGVIANFKVSLQRLLDPTIFWVCSGDEVPCLLNDPKDPIILSLGNTPGERKVLSPVLAMSIAALVSNMYGHDRNKSFVIIDELPTLFLPHLNDIPATARKYNIATVVALQAIAQLENTYGVVGARELQETFGNHVVGNSDWQISKKLSDAFGTKTVHTTSQTFSQVQRMSSTTRHSKDKAILDPQKIMTLPVGEFAGRVADSGEGFFKMKLKPISAYDSALRAENLKPLPVVHQDVDIVRNFNQIKQDVKNLVGVYSHDE